MIIIANPQSGHGNGKAYISELQGVLQRRRLDHRVEITRYAGHATQLARELCSQGCTHLAVMGGDGTIGEVVNGLGQSTADLGIISVGTGNDVARSLGLPYNNIAAALRVLEEGCARPIDLGIDQGRYFISVLGVGFPALVAGEGNRLQWLHGSAAFFVAVYKAIYRLQAVPIEIVLDDQTLELNCTSVLIQNTRYTGGGLLMAPDARVDDGLFDVVVVSAIGKIDLMLNFPRVYTGTHFQHRCFSQYRSKRVQITSPASDLPKMFDGDVLGTVPVDARVSPGALRVILPVQ